MTNKLRLICREVSSAFHGIYSQLAIFVDAHIAVHIILFAPMQIFVGESGASEQGEGMDDVPSMFCRIAISISLNSDSSSFSPANSAISRIVLVKKPIQLMRSRRNSPT